MLSLKYRTNFARWIAATIPLGIVLLTPLVLPIQVLAMGYSSINCEDLWERKQTVYKNNFYCLTEPEAIEKFGNTDCTIKDLSKITFNNDDMNILMLIARNELRKKCSKATPLLKETPLVHEKAEEEK